jgi:hypothetical protein
MLGEVLYIAHRLRHPLARGLLTAPLWLAIPLARLWLGF